VFEGKDKAVFYGGPGFLGSGGKVFAIRLEDFAQVDYRDIELSQEVQDEADQILSSLEVFCRDANSLLNNETVDNAEVVQSEVE
jgi:hypothetical protein